MSEEYAPTGAKCGCVMFRHYRYVKTLKPDENGLYKCSVCEKGGCQNSDEVDMLHRVRSVLRARKEYFILCCQFPLETSIVRCIGENELVAEQGSAQGKRKRVKRIGHESAANAGENEHVMKGAGHESKASTGENAHVMKGAGHEKREEKTVLFCDIVIVPCAARSVTDVIVVELDGHDHAHKPRQNKEKNRDKAFTATVYSDNRKNEAVEEAGMNLLRVKRDKLTEGMSQLNSMLNSLKLNVM